MEEMNLRAIHHKVVTAATGEELEDAIVEAKLDILATNKQASWLGTLMTATADTVFATIVWS